MVLGFGDSGNNQDNTNSDIDEVGKYEFDVSDTWFDGLGFLC